MAVDKLKMVMEQEPGISMNAYQMRPQTRGSIHIQSPDPSAPPVIDPRPQVRGVATCARSMPQVVPANTNGAAIMIGEKGFDLILADNR